MAMWFEEKTGKSPSESAIREKASKLYQAKKLYEAKKAKKQLPAFPADTIPYICDKARSNVNRGGLY